MHPGWKYDFFGQRDSCRLDLTKRHVYSVLESTAGGEKAQLIIVVGKRRFLWYDAAWKLSYPEYS